MQTYAAYLYLAKELKLSTYPKVLMIDIGVYTLDYMLLEKGMILWNYTDSTGKGVISMYQRVNKGIREKFDLDLKENDIDSVLKEESCMYGEAIRKRVVEIVKSRDRVVKKSEKDSLYAAMDVGCIWLERALAGK